MEFGNYQVDDIVWIERDNHKYKGRIKRINRDPVWHHHYDIDVITEDGHEPTVKTFKHHGIDMYVDEATLDYHKLYNKGDHIWFYYGGATNIGEIVIVDRDEHDQVFYHVQPKDLEGNKDGGCLFVGSDDAFDDERRCANAMLRMFYPGVKKYCDQIETVEDFNSFIDKYIDDEKLREDRAAIYAIIIRAEELGCGLIPELAELREWRNSMPHCSSIFFVEDIKLG